MKKLIIFALVICCQCTAQQLDLSNISRVDSFFTALASSKKAMGTVSVFKDGNPVYQKLLGFRDSTASGIIMPDDNTKYRIGSLSKMFTAVMIMQLSEEGKINIDSPLSVFFPQIINARSITIRQMLDHHSGLPRYEMTYELDRLKEAENETELVEKIANKAGDMEDQDKGHYSNLNYLLLGFIIEKVTHSTYDEQLHTRIADKIGLKNTYALPGYISAAKNEAHSFNYASGAWREDYELKWNFPDAAGCIVSTTADLSLFIYSLFQGSLVSSRSLAIMKDTKDRFGCGLLEIPYKSHPGYGYTGKVEGFASSLTYFPDEKLSVCLILNGQIFPVTEASYATKAILFGEPYAIPHFEIVTLSDAEIQPLLGKYHFKTKPFIVTIMRKKGMLIAEIKKKGGIFKSVVKMDALSPSRLISDAKGMIFDFNKSDSLTLTMSGAKFILGK